MIEVFKKSPKKKKKEESIYVKDATRKLAYLKELPLKKKDISKDTNFDYNFFHPKSLKRVKEKLKS